MSTFGKAIVLNTWQCETNKITFSLYRQKAHNSSHPGSRKKLPPISLAGKRGGKKLPPISLARKRGGKKLPLISLAGKGREIGRQGSGSKQPCGNGGLRMGTWPGRVPWNCWTLKLQGPLWEPRGNSRLVDGTRRVACGGAEMNLKSDGTLEKQ